MTESPQTPPPPGAPPTQPGMRQPTPRSSWPTVLGVIAIVYGALATLSHGCGLMSSLMAEQWQRMMPQPEQAAEAQIDLTRRWLWFSVPNSLLLVALAVMLIVVGAGLARRRARAVVLAKVWAVVKMIVALGAAIFTYLVMQESLGLQQEVDPNATALPPGVVEVMAPLTAVLTLLWGWLLPIFLLIWFARPSIREEVSGWAGAAEVR